MTPLPDFAASDAEAAELFAATRSTDPLSHIPPALLNTADLLDYIAATGMIWPFKLPAELDKALKPASCAIPFAGRVIAWNPQADRPDRLERFDKELRSGERLKLPHNSIVFITLQPYFRIPDYIAGRYNLTITNIYRGLLVGTGPLVDPGFEGYLSVPLHNLTGSDYELQAGDTLVWMEFTKLSPHRRWDTSARESQSPYVPFPTRKVERRGIEDYLAAASSEPVVSSIPREVGRARSAAQSAQRSVRWLQGLSAIGGVVLLVTIAALVIQAEGAIRDDGRDRSALQRQVDALQRTVNVQSGELRALRNQSQRP